MKRYVIDTNIYSAFKANAQPVIATLQIAEEILMCPTVLGELLAGFKCGKRTDTNRRDLEKFLDTPRVTTVATDYVTADFYAEIFRTLRAKGSPVPTNDMWIAASAMQHGVAVCTLDDHFSRIEGLVVVRPEM